MPISRKARFCVLAVAALLAAVPATAQSAHDKTAVATTATLSLPKPTGPYAVGFRRFELTDASRKGMPAKDPNEPRIIPAYVWYPARAAKNATRPYMSAQDAADQAPSTEKLFSVHTTVKIFAETKAYSTVDAPVLKGRGKFPIVIFSHGYPVYPQQNTVQMEEWASHGYIVIAVAHLYDTSDLRLADGRLVPSLGQPNGGPEYRPVKQQLCCGATHDIRTAALKDFARVFLPTHQGQVEKAWQDDELFLANALKTGAVPDSIKPVLANGDVNRLALTGMSYGGNTAADTCRLIDNCKVAINLDGSNYDPDLFNADVGRPFLLVMSDWVRLPLPERSNDPTFAFNDYAYEPWISAGQNKDVVRVRVDHTRHLGMTDLLLLLNDPEKEKAVGDANPRPTMAAINSVTLAFLNEYLKGGSRDALEKAIDGSPLLHRHDPSSVREWARTRKTP